MVIILYLAVVLTAGYWVIKTLAPEMAKPPLPVAKHQARSRVTPSAPVYATAAVSHEPVDKRIEKLETLIEEKNKNIDLLQNDLRAMMIQVNSFDKLKKILEDENQRLKEQNRIFRSELGLPTLQPGKVTPR